MSNTFTKFFGFDSMNYLIICQQQSSWTYLMNCHYVLTGLNNGNSFVVISSSLCRGHVKTVCHEGDK